MTTKGTDRVIGRARASEDKSRHLVVAEVDREALCGADRGERLVDLVGLDVCHHLASHRVLITRRCLENCGTSGSQIRTGLGHETRGPAGEEMECLTLVGDLGGLFESTGLDVAVERGEEVLDGYWLRGGGRRLRFGRHREAWVCRRERETAHESSTRCKKTGSPRSQSVNVFLFVRKTVLLSSLFLSFFFIFELFSIFFLFFF